MKFELPNAVAAMNNAVAAVGEDGDSWEIIGDPLTRAVDEVVPGYDEKLDLKLDPSAGAKRAEVCTVRWGRIEKDVARLNGLVAAIRNVSSVIKSGKDTIAHEWKGESFDAFRAQIEKVEKTLDDYATAVETTAAGMTAAIDGTRRMFTTYRDDTVEKHLVFDRFSPPGDWWRMSSNDAEHFVEHCGSQTAISDCLYNNDEQVAIIDRKLTNRRFHDQVTQWDCTRDPGVVIGQYRYLVESADDERTVIRDKIHNWYVATDELKTGVREALDAALENLRIIAEVKVFSAFAVPGATAPAGAPSGDPGPGTGGGSPGPGAGSPGPGPGYPGPGGGGGDVAMPSPGPAPEPAPAPEAEPEPVQAEPDPAQAAETVSIKDGDRTISVSSPDGQGHVKLTVDDGSGTPKTYALDFDAASGLAPRPTDGEQAVPEEGVEQVPARSDGKCVIQDGAVTITAERPLFSPDSLSITVDDGSGSPTSYTLDFPQEPDTADAPGAQPDPAPAAAPGGASPAPAAAPAAERPETAQPATATGPAGQDATAQPATPAAQEQAARSAAGAGQEQVARSGMPTGQDSAVQSAAAGQGQASRSAMPSEQEPAAQPVGQAAQEQVARSAAAGPEPAAQSSALPGQEQVARSAMPTGQDAVAQAAASAVQEQVARSAAAAGLAPATESSVSVGQEHAASHGPAQPVAAGQATQPQSWISDQSGSLSGVLESDQSRGEAGLASVPDDPAREAADATGMAGAGLPMVGGASGGGSEPGRAGSGWSVHGDLFDSGEPVYSMHGVLGDDDLEPREVR